jgi:hypothetical protein
MTRCETTFEVAKELTSFLIASGGALRERQWRQIVQSIPGNTTLKAL